MSELNEIPTEKCWCGSPLNEHWRNEPCLKETRCTKEHPDRDAVLHDGYYQVGDCPICSYSYCPNCDGVLY